MCIFNFSGESFKKCRKTHGMYLVSVFHQHHVENWNTLHSFRLCLFLLISKAPKYMASPHLHCSYLLAFREIFNIEIIRKWSSKLVALWTECSLIMKRVFKSLKRLKHILSWRNKMHLRFIKNVYTELKGIYRSNQKVYTESSCIYRIKMQNQTYLQY